MLLHELKRMIFLWKCSLVTMSCRVWLMLVLIAFRLKLKLFAFSSLNHVQGKIALNFHFFFLFFCCRLFLWKTFEYEFTRFQRSSRRMDNGFWLFFSLFGQWFGFVSFIWTLEIARLQWTLCSSKNFSRRWSNSNSSDCERWLLWNRLSISSRRFSWKEIFFSLFLFDFL